MVIIYVMYKNFEKDKEFVSPDNKKNTVLFILTFICILFFVILMLRSYQIYNKQNNLDSLETILSTNNNVKEKADHTNQIFNIPNIENSYYDELDKNTDEINQIILNTDSNLTTNAQEKTIDDLFHESETTNLIVQNESVELDNMINNIQNNYNISNHKFIVQVASLKNRIYAEKYVDSIKKNYTVLVQDLDIYINETHDHHQKFYRIQFGTFDTKNQAEIFCETLKEKTKIQSCIILKK